MQPTSCVLASRRDLRLVMVRTSIKESSRPRVKGCKDRSEKIEIQKEVPRSSQLARLATFSKPAPESMNAVTGEQPKSAPNEKQNAWCHRPGLRGGKSPDCCHNAGESRHV